ncbi:metal-dependent hydrolase [Methanoregula sp.]|uniref:metal-dependent hydrolase n=1 Tax=Methanoregula sp. TaxID=2052170 RepID=UPI002BB36EF0|nr:metal-dependent hydrolase [Methanoregula sp.]HVP96310.1 metal-dependent hydrolase [Methanoregula sp.]
MDSLTHALVAAILAYALGLPQILPFFVLGAVIIDADILFSFFSRRHPSLYLFIHGGIAHSLAGAVAMAVLAYTGILLAAASGVISPAVIAGAGPAGAGAVFGGAFLHLVMDLPATPGIPLIAPVSDRKFSLFALPGPSILLMGVSLFFAIWMALGVVTLAEGMAVYAAIFCTFLLVRAAAFLASRPALRGAVRAIPQVNPLRWLAIYDHADAWEVQEYRIGFGRVGSAAVYPKFTQMSEKEAASYLALPEVRRLRYHSYIVTAERSGEMITFSDPLRVSGKIFYPPHDKQVRIPAGKQVVP